MGKNKITKEIVENVAATLVVCLLIVTGFLLGITTKRLVFNMGVIEVRYNE